MQRQLYTFSVRVEIKERENLREGYNPSGRTCGDLSGLDGLYARKIRCAQESRDAYPFVFWRCFRGLFVAGRSLSLSYRSPAAGFIAWVVRASHIALLPMARFIRSA